MLYLENWNYEYSAAAAASFNEASIDEQLRFLEKWLPIGMACKRLARSSLGQTIKQSALKKEYIITGYSISGGIYNAIVESKAFEKKEWTESNKTHPMLLKPTPEWIRKISRDNKLKDLLDD